jgi:hypothetical protein
MPVIPSENEEEYFAKQELELKRKLAKERQAQMQAAERESAKALHYMKCPKCGMQLEEVAYHGVNVDKCFSCEGVFLDKGEIERIQGKESGFLGKLFGSFGS